MKVIYDSDDLNHSALKKLDEIFSSLDPNGEALLFNYHGSRFSKKETELIMTTPELKVVNWASEARDYEEIKHYIPDSILNKFSICKDKTRSINGYIERFGLTGEFYVVDGVPMAYYDPDVNILFLMYDAFHFIECFNSGSERHKSRAEDEVALLYKIIEEFKELINHKDVTASAEEINEKIMSANLLPDYNYKTAMEKQNDQLVRINSNLESLREDIDMLNSLSRLSKEDFLTPELLGFFRLKEDWSLEYSYEQIVFNNKNRNFVLSFSEGNLLAQSHYLKIMIAIYNKDFEKVVSIIEQRSEKDE